MSKNVKSYTRALEKLKTPYGKPTKPIWSSEVKDFSKEHNISAYQHQPLGEALGRDIGEPEIELFNLDTENTGYTLPGTTYEGPGNSVNRGPARGHADTTAQQHDLEYFDAQYLLKNGFITQDEFDGKIYESDKKAVSEFNEGETIGDVLGHDGLQFKRFGEIFTKHPIYPSAGKMPINWKNIAPEHLEYVKANQKHPNFETHFSKIRPNWFTDEPSAKKAKPIQATKRPIQDNKVSSSIDSKKSKEVSASSTLTVDPTIPETIGEMTSLPGTAGENKENEGEMMMYEPPVPVSHFPTFTTTFNKVHRMISFGIANTWLTKDFTTPTENQFWLTTGLAQIPWQFPFMYMSPAEFNLLTNGAKCIEVRLRVVHRGTRIAFQTASSDTGLATLNQIQNIMVAEGLNKTGYGTDVNYTGFSATQPMLPTSFQGPQLTELEQEFYGLDQQNASFTSYIPNHQIGTQTVAPNYFAMVTSKQSFGGVPALTQHVKMMDGKKTIDQTVLTCSYKPHIAPLNTPLKNIRFGLPLIENTNPFQVPLNGTRTWTETWQANLGSSDATGNTIATTKVDNVPANTSFLGNDFTLFSELEKGQFMKVGPWGQEQTHPIQPSAHVGLQPIPTLTTSALMTKIAAWTDAQVDWDIFCEMDVEQYRPTHMPYATAPNVRENNVVYRTQVTAFAPDTCTYNGIYPNTPIRGFP